MISGMPVCGSRPAEKQMKEVEATWEPYEEHGRLTTRSNLPDTVFAFPRQRKEPLTDVKHVRNAAARFDQVIDVSDEDRALAFANIEKAMIWPKPRGSSDAPPTSAPSMSGFCNNALALSGFTLPPYWIRTAAETVWSEIEAITDRCWLVAAAMVMTAFAYCCAFTAVEVNISAD
jgi:hypothetical protein